MFNLSLSHELKNQVLKSHTPHIHKIIIKSLSFYYEHVYFTYAKPKLDWENVI
jgi:bifunctional DNase/RNase